MKALMISTEKLPVPPVRGGAIQTYIDGVSPLLRQHCDLTILGSADPRLAQQETVNGIRYVRIPAEHFAGYCEGVVRFLRQNAFDLIHIFNRPRLVGPVREAAPHARIFLSMHNDMFQPKKIAPEEAQTAIRESERIITVSDYIGLSLTERYPQAADKLQTVYSGVDIAKYVPCQSEEARKVRNALRKKHGIAGRKAILYVGRFSPKKGVDVLVRAMPELARRHPEIALVLVGSKWYSENKLSDYVAYVLSLTKRSPVPVVTTGFVHPQEIPKWYWVGDIFVCSSQWQEPLARVHYEAMASGLPIVTTARGGNPEVVFRNENGLIVDRPQEPSVFAEKLSLLLSDEELCRRLGQRGRALAEKHFRWERVAREILQIWQVPGPT
ncbi:spore coat protein CotSA [Bacillaceae bacterium]